MFWLFLLLIILMVAGCYVAYKEARHHELHKLRAEFSDLRDKHMKAFKTAEDNDPDIADYFKGEFVAIDEALDILKQEDADCDLIQEIENDIKKVKEKVTSLFNK